MSLPLKLSLKLSILVLAAAAFASPVMARDGYRGHGNNQGRNSQHDRRNDQRHDRSQRHDQRRGNYRHRNDRIVYVPGWPQPAYRVAPQRPYYRHAPPARVYYPAPGSRWARGGRYYGPGYGRTYVVNDYGYYGLRAPPRGHYWRRDDRGTFLLVAIASGVIADLVLRGGY